MAGGYASGRGGCVITISAAITVKNRLPNIFNCVLSLHKAGVDEICIADFNSDDTNWDWLSEIDIARLEKVKGSFSIGKGKNAAGDMATSDIIFFLDADLIVSREALKAAKRACENNLVYAPIMYMDQQGWATHSFGQVAMLKDTWAKCKRWPEWHSYGGEDNIFIHQFGQHIIRDFQPGLVHQYHDQELREKYYRNPAGTDLEQWRKDNNWRGHAT